MQFGKSLVVLCGDSKLDLNVFSEVVVISPSRRFELNLPTPKLYTLSDFAPDEDTGEALDAKLYRDLDHCLHAEARTNSALRWAPVSYLQLQLRLARYCWLKQTLEKVLRELSPTSIVLSSKEDRDLVYALRFIAIKNKMPLELHDGKLDQGTTQQHQIRPYGLPQRLDPNWITKLRWSIWRAQFGKRDCLVQPYWNLDLHDRTSFPLKSFSAINLLGRVADKLQEVLHIRDRTAAIDRPVELQEGLPELFKSETWRQQFGEDELLVINNVLTAFTDDFPAPLLDGIEQALLNLFDAVGIRRVVMLHDRLDACRMIAHAAHRKGIAVDYLPHGIVLEDFSGKSSASPFVPDRILAWNEASAHKLRQLGWNAIAISHPQFNVTPQPLRKLSKSWRGTRVLVLVPDWVCVTQGEQEDCLIADLAETYEALTRLGVNAKDIHVKYHSGTLADGNAKRAGLTNLRDVANMNFTLLETSARTINLIPQYDLVILGLTSGIFEAVMLGVPLVIFGLSPARFCTLTGYALPYARNADELVRTLQEFDNEKTRAVYDGLAASLRAGISVNDALGKVAVPACP